MRKTTPKSVEVLWGVVFGYFKLHVRFTEQITTSDVFVGEFVQLTQWKLKLAGMPLQTETNIHQRNLSTAAFLFWLIIIFAERQI